MVTEAVVIVHTEQKRCPVPNDSDDCDKIPRVKHRKGGMRILCGRDSCQQLLGVSYGGFLDCFAFTVSHRLKMRCEACGYETRWGPGKESGDKESGDDVDPGVIKR